MKLAAFTDGDGQLSWGVLDDDRIIDVPATARERGEVAPADIKAFLETRNTEWLENLIGSGRTVDRDRDSLQLRAPLPNAGKIIAVGRNYLDHVGEASIQLPSMPKIFPKFASTVIGPGDPIVRPSLTSQLDFEVEVGLVIGQEARHIALDAAMDHVAGYTALNDISARDIQFTDEQLTLGKNFDTFCPMGPVVTTVDEMPDPSAIELSLRLNGKVMQDSSTEHLIFPIPYLVYFLSHVMTLSPGDVVLTGTPSGVGCFRDPPVWLEPGDTVETHVEGVGTLVNPVIASDHDAPQPAHR